MKIETALHCIFIILLIIVSIVNMFVHIDFVFLCCGLIWYISALLRTLSEKNDIIDLYSRALYATVYDEHFRIKFKKSIGGDK